MNKLIFPILLMILLVSCTEYEELQPGLKAGSFKPYPEERKELIISEMKNQNIDFQIDDEGFIVYLARDIATVRGIQRKSLRGDNPNPNEFLTVTATQAEFRKKYITALNRHKVNYRTADVEGTFNILYFPVDSEKVDRAYQDAYIETYESKNN